MNKKKKKKGKKNPIPKLKKEIASIFEDNLQKSFTPKQIIKKLGLKNKKEKKAVPDILYDLEDKGFLKEDQSVSFKINSKEKEYEGVVDYVSSRYAYIITEELESDIWVSADNLNNALDGDKVKVSVYKFRKDKRAEGKVTAILERKRTDYVGRIELSPRYAFVIADYKKMHHDIFVRLEDLKEAKNKDKVLVKIKEWPEYDKNPVGEIIRVLGPAGNNEAEIHSIIAEFGLPYEFPEKVLKQAEKIKTKIPKEEIDNRRDFRNITTFTIDPADAKDFDDALSIRKLDNGNHEVGVHIADVTHYVKKDSLIDKEGLERSTSVYLVDRTIPMLPEKLSNQLCSLRPDEEKLTFSAVFELDDNAVIKNEWFGKTIIKSARRFTYEEAQERIETIEGDFAKELTLLNELALKLRVERYMRGAINFETTEVKFELDENGKPLKVIPKIRKDAHKLIEEFMLLANKRVAEFVHNKKKGKERLTYVYRTHDYPDPDKIKAFSVFAEKFGHKLNTKEDAISKSLNNLIEDIEGKPEQDILQSLAIRAMAKAKYTTEEVGHFGLAFDHYTHFTSPIRRYPDMMSHRLLQHYLEGGNSVNKENYEEKCIHSSEMERRAVEAERASIKYKQVEFMQNYLMEEFEGIVSGVTEWGVYVEIIETKCEGMVRVSQMEDDYYEYDDQNLRLIGQKNKRIFTLGDHVNVRVIATDIDRRTIDLEFVD